MSSMSNASLLLISVLVTNLTRIEPCIRLDFNHSHEYFIPAYLAIPESSLFSACKITDGNSQPCPFTSSNGFRSSITILLKQEILHLPNTYLQLKKYLSSQKPQEPYCFVKQSLSPCLSKVERRAHQNIHCTPNLKSRSKSQHSQSSPLRMNSFKNFQKKKTHQSRYQQNTSIPSPEYFRNRPGCIVSYLRVPVH